ncbi:hypothetical protein V2J09_007749 [Rumex salicifolius]
MWSSMKMCFPLLLLQI